MGFSFGKKKRHSKKHGKKHAKPPAKLLRICKKYRVKATKKVGGKRMYKSVATLKKLCLRKARALRKKLIKMHKKSMKHHKKTHKRRVTKKTHSKRRGDAFGEDEAMMSFGRRRARFGEQHMNGKEHSMMSFGRRRSGFGNIAWIRPVTHKTFENSLGKRYARMDYNQSDLLAAEQCLGAGKRADITCYDVNKPAFGRRRPTRARFGMKIGGYTVPGTEFGNGRLPMFGMKIGGYTVPGTEFGKRRATKKVSKSAAMKAFRSFYKRHCSARKSGFGNGGNPPLNASMGYEFCPNGMGGVLGFNSTGLFPSPCISQGSSAPVQMGSLPPPTKVSQGGFGRRRPTHSRRANSTGKMSRANSTGKMSRGHRRTYN